MYREMRENIAALTPKFSIERLLNHLEMKGICRDECESIRNKVLVTPEEILSQFSSFFLPARDRPDIWYFAAAFQSLEESIRDSQVKSINIKVKLE